MALRNWFQGFCDRLQWLSLSRDLKGSRRRKSHRSDSMAVAALESRILMSGTAPTIESLAFANPVANYGMVSGDFAGVLADATPASYYTIEIDTNNDQMPDLSGMTGSPGSFNSYGSLPLGTTSPGPRDGV